MLRPRFLWKLYAGYLALLLGAAATMGALVARQTSQDIHESARQLLQNQTVALRNFALQVLDAPDPSIFAADLQRQGDAIGSHITIIRSDGVAIVDSVNNPAHMQNQAERPEVAAARQHSGIGVDIRLSPRANAPTMYLAQDLRREDARRGYIRVAMPLTRLRQRLAYVWRAAWLAGGGAAVVGLGFSVYLARQVADPLRRMTDAAIQLAGQYAPQPAFMRAKDEIENLSSAFDRMARHLRDRMETIIKDRNQLLAVLGGMVEGVIAVDADERVMHMNQAAGAILQVAPDGSIGKHIWEVTRVRAVVETLDSAINDAENITCEVSITRPQELTLKLNASPLRDSRGASVGAVMVLHDVTDIRRLENIRRDFVANVSHELKTPITTIKGFVETLRDGALDDREHAHRFLDIIANNGDRLHAIIEDLLSLSRLEQTEQIAGLVRQDTVLSRVIERAVRGCEVKAEAREVMVATDCDPNLRFSANASLIEQAIVNLLDNAINYSKAGGAVRIAAARQDDAITICVADEGVGIPQEHLPRLFERFYRVDKARSREGGGTGLGLAIVKHIAQAHGGQVTVTSRIGKGSAFTLRLPAA